MKVQLNLTLEEAQYLSHLVASKLQYLVDAGVPEKAMDQPKVLLLAILAATTEAVTAKS